MWVLCDHNRLKWDPGLSSVAIPTGRHQIDLVVRSAFTCRNNMVNLQHDTRRPLPAVSALEVVALEYLKASSDGHGHGTLPRAPKKEGPGRLGNRPFIRGHEPQTRPP